ncbi:unnamed protein product, partial [Closterium sp. Naga37s-1]
HRATWRPRPWRPSVPFTWTLCAPPLGLQRHRHMSGRCVSLRHMPAAHVQQRAAEAISHPTDRLSSVPPARICSHCCLMGRQQPLLLRCHRPSHCPSPSERTTQDAACNLLQYNIV